MEKFRFQKIIITLSIVFWPISLFLANTFPDFINYIIPAGLLLTSFYLSKAKSKYPYIPLIIIPLIQPKFLLFPLIYLLIELLWERKRNITKYLALSLTLAILLWKPFWGQTIFQPDYEARQQVIRNTYLYPNVLLARTFQNKVRMVTNKFGERFFAITDPNNYFFGFAPRQITVENQNLTKYPFIALPFMLYGLWHLGKSKHKRFIVKSSVAGILTLSILTNFDRNDFLLWVPFSLILIHGIKQFVSKHKLKIMKISFWIFMVFVIPELIRMFL